MKMRSIRLAFVALLLCCFVGVCDSYFSLSRLKNRPIDVFTLRYDTNENKKEIAAITDNVFFKKGSRFPSQFNNMCQWTEQRDFLSSFGATYENSITIEKGVYVERRHYAHKLALRMKTIENDYALVTSDENNNKMSSTIRLFTEGSLAFFAPKDGWPMERAMVGEQLRYLRKKWGDTEFVQFLDCCDRLNDLSKQDLHEHIVGDGITTQNRAKVIDDVYLAATYVRCGLEKLFPEDAERARGEIKGLAIATQQVVWRESEESDNSLSDVEMIEIETTDPENVESETEQRHRAWIEEQEKQLETTILKRREKETEEAKIRLEELLQMQKNVEKIREAWEVSERKKLQVQIAVRQRMLKEENEKALLSVERAKKQIVAPIAVVKVRKVDKKEIQREKERKRQDALMKKNNKRQEKVKELAVADNLMTGMKQLVKNSGAMAPFSFENFVNSMKQFQSRLESVEGPWQELGKLVGGNVRGYASAINDFGVELARHNKNEEALSMFKQSQKVMEETFGPDHPDTLTIVINVAGAMENTGGDLNEIREMLEKAFHGLLKAFGPEHKFVILAELRVASILYTQHEYVKALAIHDRALPAYENLLGFQDIMLPKYLHQQGQMLLTLGDFDRAIPVLEKVLLHSENVYGTDHPETISYAMSLANIARYQGDQKRALDLTTRVFAVYKTKLGPHDSRTIFARVLLNDLEANSPLFYENKNWIADMFGKDEVQFSQWVHDTKIQLEQGTVTMEQINDLV